MALWCDCVHNCACMCIWQHIYDEHFQGKIVHNRRHCIYGSRFGSICFICWCIHLWLATKTWFTNKCHANRILTEVRENNNGCVSNTKNKIDTKGRSCGHLSIIRYNIASIKQSADRVKLFELLMIWMDNLKPGLIYDF